MIKIDNSNDYNVGIYIRTGKYLNTNEVVDKQKRILDTFVNNNNLKVHKYYIDIGTRDEKDGLNNMIKDIQARKINMIIVKATEVLTRDLFIFLDIMSIIEQNEARYIAVEGDIDSEDSSFFLKKNKDIFIKWLEDKKKDEMKKRRKYNRFKKVKTN